MSAERTSILDILDRNNVELNPAQRRAIALAEKGYKVHPVHKDEKKPILDAWPDHATNDPQTAFKMFAPYPDANVGVACAMDVIVIDADGEEGMALAAELGLGEPTVRTPTKAGHYYFKPPANVVFSNSTRVEGCLDVRHVGGQVLAPGSKAWSRHPGQAHVYGEYIGELPPVAELPPLPLSVHKLLLEAHAPYDKDWIGGVGEWEPKVPEKLWERIKFEPAGGPTAPRYRHCYAVMAALFDAGLTDDEVAVCAASEGARFAGKFIERDDLDRQILRSRREWKHGKQDGFKVMPDVAAPTSAEPEQLDDF